MKLFKSILLLLFTVLLAVHSSSQTRLRRDVLLMVDSIEMAYSYACPEVIIKDIPPEDRKADEIVIERLNTLYYETSTFSTYRSSLLQNGFTDNMHDDEAGLKHVTFSLSQGNLAAMVDIKYLHDSIINREVYLETRTHTACFRKNGDFMSYYIDIYYIRSLVPLIKFPFRVTLAEPTLTKFDMENE